MTDWQPIETAPLDRPILLATTAGVCVGKYDDWHDRFHLVDDDGWLVLAQIPEGSPATPAGTVIYWAPLPVLLTSA